VGEHVRRLVRVAPRAREGGEVVGPEADRQRFDALPVGGALREPEAVLLGAVGADATLDRGGVAERAAAARAVGGEEHRARRRFVARVHSVTSGSVSSISMATASAPAIAA